jgi:hypothetical protein
MAEENSSMRGTVMRQLAKTHRSKTIVFFKKKEKMRCTVLRQVAKTHT